MEDRCLFSNASTFRKNHGLVKEIAHGGEGAVSLWKNKSSETLIVVKKPVANNKSVKHALKEEVRAMEKLGEHPHIVRFLGAADDWPKVAPALFYDYCELGDVQQYNKTLFKAGKWISEMTLWKFIVDTSKGLDYLHNDFGISYVHGDLKPSNILVCRSPNDNAELPTMPTFKLADISHLKAYKPRQPKYQHPSIYQGTWEYAPPMEERNARLAPPVDIWAIGASLQTLAWGILPVKSNEAIRKEMKAQGYPCLTDAQIQAWRYNDEFRRTKLPFVWRPLNASPNDQLQKYDMRHPCPPYSDLLNNWYAMCLHQDPQTRVNARVLKEHFIPHAEQQIKLLTCLQRRDEAHKKVSSLKAKAAERQKLKAKVKVKAGRLAPPVAQVGLEKDLWGKRESAKSIKQK
jgi:serine/threonine protein kinase